MNETTCLLLDLDGTLVDTAPDLAYALNQLREANNLDPLPINTIRPHVSRGVRGLLDVGFGIADGDTNYEELSQALLDIYDRNICRESALFDGIEQVLQHFESNDRCWGIVTNKRHRYTEPLITALNLDQRSRCIVSGDSAEHAKPHPAPILLALSQAGANPENTVYVGDAQRDIVAGRAAGLKTVAAAWGYIELEPPVHDWGADRVAGTTEELMRFFA